MNTARPSHAWSLGHELSTIEQATAGCASVLSRVHDLQGDGRAMRAGVAEAEAMLSLVHRRLHDLGRVLRGELDPWLLAAPHNVVGAGDERTNHGEDVVFAPKADVRADRAGRRSPGEAVVAVVLDKMPFPVMGDPVLDALSELAFARTGDRWTGWREESLPRATLALRQGAGRLIRSVTDWGVVVVCDPRLTSKAYGAGVIKSLGMPAQARSLAAVAQWFRSRSSS